MHLPFDSAIPRWKLERALIWKNGFFSCLGYGTEYVSMKSIHSKIFMKGLILRATEERAHIYSEGQRNGWLKSDRWEGDSQACELVHLPVKQDSVKDKPSQREWRNVSATLTHFTPGWVILVPSDSFMHFILLEIQGKQESCVQLEATNLLKVILFLGFI